MVVLGFFPPFGAVLSEANIPAVNGQADENHGENDEQEGTSGEPANQAGQK